MSLWVQILVVYGLVANAMALVVPAVTIVFDEHEGKPPSYPILLIAVQIIVGLLWPVTLPLMIWKLTHLDDG